MPAAHDVAAVATAGLAGIDTASTAPHGGGSPEIAAVKAALARQHAVEQLAAALERAELAREQADDQDVEAVSGDPRVKARAPRPRGRGAFFAAFWTVAYWYIWRASRR